MRGSTCKDFCECYIKAFQILSFYCFGDDIYSVCGVFTTVKEKK